MFRQGQLAVHGLAILLGRNEAGISNRGKFFCTTLYRAEKKSVRGLVKLIPAVAYHFCLKQSYFARKEWILVEKEKILRYADI